MLSKLKDMDVASTSETPWDLWIDYQSCDDDGLTHGDLSHARVGLVVKPGMDLIVGNEDADLANAEVVRVVDGIVFLRVKSDLVTQPSKSCRKACSLESLKSLARSANEAVRGCVSHPKLCWMAQRLARRSPLTVAV